jgi:hypothetical protein
MDCGYQNSWDHAVDVTKLQRYDPRLLDYLVADALEDHVSLKVATVDQDLNQKQHPYAVLDLGSGWGGLSFSFYKRWSGRSVRVLTRGITISQEQLRVTKDKSQEHCTDAGERNQTNATVSCEFHLKSYDSPDLASLLPPSSQSGFDAAVAVESLVHSDSLLHTLRNVVDALRPGVADEHAL